MMAAGERTVVIIQARMGSTRLPGKVLKNLMGHTVLWHVVNRVRRARGVDEVVVATSTKPSDDAIEREAKAAGASCFRGSELDVLDRYYEAATFARASTIVRVTSDCPLYDAEVLSRMLARWKERNEKGRRIDYLSNGIKRTFPRGLDTEIFSFAALERAHDEATLPEEREHVTLHIYRHPEEFALDNFENDVDLSTLRWTLDTDDDWRLIETVYERLSRPGETFSTQDVLALLKREPALARLNAHVEQKKLGAS